MLTLNNETMLAALTQLLAAGGPYNACKIALVSSGPLPPGPGNVFADYTLATYTGGAPITPTFGTPYVDAADGQGYADAFASFLCTATPVGPEIITGYIITDGAGAVLKGGDLFPNAITISAAGQTIEFVCRLKSARAPGGQAIMVP